MLAKLRWLSFESRLTKTATNYPQLRAAYRIVHPCPIWYKLGHGTYHSNGTMQHPATTQMASIGSKSEHYYLQLLIAQPESASLHA
jgi:hypothetical protein